MHGQMREEALSHREGGTALKTDTFPKGKSEGGGDKDCRESVGG